MPLRLEYRSPSELAENPRNWRRHPESQIAAHRLGRRCYGCEIEPRYADVILKRTEAEGLTCSRVLD